MLKLNFKFIFQSLYIYILFTLLCYNNFITGVNLGAFAQSPVLFLAPFFMIIELYHFFKYKKANYSEIDQIILLYIVYSICISIFIMLYFMIYKGTSSFQNSSYIPKFLSYLVTTIMLYATYRHAKYIFNKFNKKNIYFGIMFAVITQFIILGIELTSMPDAFSKIHFVVPTPYYRIRLWASEASISGFYVPILSMIFFYYASNVARSFIGKFICISFFLTYTIVSNSKGFYLSLVLAIILFLIVIFFWYSNKNRNIIILIISVIVIPAISISFLPIIMEKMSSSNEAITLSTRLLDTISALFGIYDYPLGSGFGVHQEVLFNSLKDNSDKLSYILGSNIDIKEIDGFSYTFYGLDNKNFLNFTITTTGVFGIFLLYKLLKYFLSRKFEQFIQLYLFLFVAISLCLSISFVGNYLLAVYIAFVEVNCLLNKQFTIQYEKNSKLTLA